MQSAQHGPTKCPQLVAQDGQILVSDGLSTEIMVTGENLPDVNKVYDTSTVCRHIAK